MIAVVSSTIRPVNKNEKAVSHYSFEERLEQTRLTLTQLHKHGFADIFLVDNSPSLDRAQLQNLLIDFPEVKIYHIQQYQFINKGINELLMLLFLIEHLPPDQNIFKISGRYYPTEQFKKPAFGDFAVKHSDYSKKNGTVSTRGYWVKNAETYHRFLLGCLDELFAYPERIVGIKSLCRLLFTKKKLVDDALNISIEFAAANVLKSENYQVCLLYSVGIEGYIAGYGRDQKVTE